MVDTQTVPAVTNATPAGADMETLRKALAGATVDHQELTSAVRRLRRRVAHLQARSRRFAHVGLSEYIDKLSSP